MVALVTDAFGGRGGMSQYNRDLLAAFAGAEMKLIVLPRLALDLAEPPTDWIRQLRPRPGRINYAVGALSRALTMPFDILFCGHLYMAPLAALIARLKGAKLIVQMHGIDAWERPSALQRAATEAADLVLCVSRHTRDAVLRWAAIAPERVLVLPNTVRDVFTPGPRCPALLAKYGLQGKLVIITVSRINKVDAYNGHAAVIRALRTVRYKYPDIAYLVVGGGDNRSNLEDSAVALGLGEIVRFAG